MIRKILLFIAISFTVAWFTGAYLIKANIALLIKNTESDNIKLSYSDIKVSGFPTIWKIDLINPKVTFINSLNSQEISTKELACLFDFSLKNAKLKIAKELRYKQNLNHKKAEYLIYLRGNTETTIQTNKLIYNISNRDNIDTIIKIIKLKGSLLSFTCGDKEMFNITDLIFALNKDHHNENEDILVTMQALYKGDDSLLNFNSADLTFDGVFNTSVMAKLPRYINSLKVNELNLKFEGSAIALKGTMDFYKDNIPQGKFAVNLYNYDNLICNIIPEHFIIPRTILKKLIERVAAKHSDDIEQSNNIALVNNIKFDLEFSKNGINIDSVSLLDFKIAN